MPSAFEASMATNHERVKRHRLELLDIGKSTRLESEQVLEIGFGGSTPPSSSTVRGGMVPPVLRQIALWNERAVWNRGITVVHQLGKLASQ